MIVRLTTTAICGSDLHLIHGMIPNLPTDYVIGHEPMGIVEETGPGVTKLKKRRPGYHPVQYRLRRMLLLQAPAGKSVR